MSGVLEAFGLRVAAADLELPGAEGAGDADLHVEVVPTAEAVRDAFSGPADPPRTAVREVDGRSVLYERGRAGDLHVRWEGAGAFRVTPASIVAWGPDAQDAAWRRFLLDSVLVSAALLRGDEALHAGAVALPGGGAVAIAAGQGGGKTTLCCELLARGAQLVADDVTVVRRAADGTLHVLPGPPVLNLARKRPSGAPAADVLGHVIADLGEEAWVHVDRSSRVAAPLRAVVILRRGAAPALALHAQPASPVPLLALLLDTGDDPARAASRFELVADLAQRVPLLLLDAPPSATPAALGDALETGVAAAMR